jgi:MoaA/NifB/PqqE/SkfB family radical SAM enzyme
MVLKDAQNGTLQHIYKGEHQALGNVPAARHDLLPKGYFFGSIQISRGCPLACSFCSVTSFNGGHFRRRPIENVVAEFKLMKERHILIVDDNLIGTRKDQMEHTKELFRAMIAAKINKRWIAQVTVNMADDDELLRLARKAGCFGVFIGFESGTIEGLEELHKRYSMRSGRSIKDSIRRSGENISAREVESVACAIPGILECAAVGVPDELRGQEVKLCLVLQTGGHVTPETVIAHCTAKLAAFKVPRYIEYFEAFPRTSSGKIAKQELAKAGQHMFDRTRNDL